MKLIKPLFLVAILGIIVQSCNDDDLTQQLDTVNVRFSGSLAASHNDGRMLNEEVPTHLIITIITLAGGEPVLDMERIELYKLGNSYISESVALPLGTYKVTDFLLVTESNEVVYAVPKYGSTMEKAVSKPLPFQFYVGKDDVFQYDLEVLSTSGYEAEDLGYASFTSKVVNPLRVAVFGSDDPSLPTSAKAAILQNGDTIKKFSLQPKINLISFPGEKDSDYRIVVEKTGYATFEMEFNYSGLTKTLDNLLLEVVIERSFSFLAYADVNTNDNIFTIALGGKSGTLFIDYGDGTSITHSLDPNIADSYIHHTYPGTGNYQVTITGDIELIEVFDSYYGLGMIDEIDFTGLTGLEDISFGLTRGPAVVDLSQCKKLSSIDIAGINELEDLILPDENLLTTVTIEGPCLLDTSDVDDIINKIYASVLVHHQRGLLEYRLNWMSNSGEVIGPPSADAIVKLTELRDIYKWQIVPPL